MKDCDNSTRKIHTSNNFILSTSLLIMFDTLLLRPSKHCNTPLHFTLHPTTLHCSFITKKNRLVLLRSTIPISFEKHTRYRWENAEILLVKLGTLPVTTLSPLLASHLKHMNPIDSSVSHLL